MKNRWIIRAAIGVVVVLAAAIILTKMFMFHSPKELYFLAQRDGIQSAQQTAQILFGERLAFMNQMKGNPYQADNKVTASIQTSGPQEPNAGTLAKVNAFLGKLNLTSLTLHDPAKHESYAKVLFQYGGGNLLTLQGFHSGTVTALGIPELYGKNVLIQNDAFGSFMRKVDPTYKGPDSLNAWSPQNNADHAALEKLSADYGMFMYKTLDKSWFTMKRIDVKTSSGTNKLRQVSLSMTSQQFKDFLTKLIDKAKTDDRFISALTASDAQPADAKKKLQDSLNQAEESLAKLSFPDGVHSVLVLDGKGRAVERHWTFTAVDAKTKQGASFDLRVQSIEAASSGSGTGRWTLKVLPYAHGKPADQTGTSGPLSLNGQYSMKQNEKGHADLTETVSYILPAKTNRDKTGKITLHYSKIKDSNGAFSYTANVEFAGGGANPDTLSLLIDSHNDYGASHKHLAGTSQITLHANSGKLQTGGSLKLNVSSDIKIGGPVTLPSFDSSNSVDITHMSRTELENLAQKYATGSIAWAIKNSYILQGLGLGNPLLPQLP